MADEREKKTTTTIITITVRNTQIIATIGISIIVAHTTRPIHTLTRTCSINHHLITRCGRIAYGSLFDMSGGGASEHAEMPDISGGCGSGQWWVGELLRWSDGCHQQPAMLVT